MSRLVVLLVSAACLICLATSAPLVLDGSKLERVFDGIGGLSGGGATSRFLPSYAEPYISQILDFLFLPNFGASLHILKVEIGGDTQSTEGTESSHMHTKDDLNFERGYEWWLMTEAKKRNPEIKLYGLSWGVPGWIGNGQFFTQDNIDYHIKWIQGAKKVYDLDIDYIGVWNERGYDVDWIINFRAQLDAAGFTHTQIVGHDALNFDIVPDIQKNPKFAQAVSIVGVHYPGTSSPADAQALGKPLWASEDYWTVGNTHGGGHWARLINQNYVNGYFTGTIAWNLIAAYYSDLPDADSSLMYAMQPWSGHYDVQSPIWASAHTTQFTKPGYIYLAHGSGSGWLPNGGSYVTLVPPQNKDGDFSLIIETMSGDLSVTGPPPSPQTVTFQLQGGLSTNKPLYVWYTHLNVTSNNTYFERINVLKPNNGQFTLSLDVDSVFTVTTLTGQKRGTYPDPPPSKPFPAVYTDNFNNYAVGQEASYFMDQTGVWEIYEGAQSKVMRQVITILPIVWCGESTRPISVIGAYSAADQSLTIDALIETTGSVGVGVRVQAGGCGDNYGSGGYFFSVTERGAWNLSAGTTVLKEGTTTFSANKFYTLGISTSGSLISASINGQVLATVNDTRYELGFASIGSGWNYAQFDNVKLVRNGEGCGTGNLVRVGTCGSSQYESWSLQPDKTLRLLNSSNCLEVAGKDPSTGSDSVRTLPCNPSLSTQQWRIQDNMIITVPTSRCLDITHQSTGNCAAIEVYDCNRGLNQLWQVNNGKPDNRIITLLDNYCLIGNA